MAAVVADTSTMAENANYQKPTSQNNIPSIKTAVVAKKKNFTAATFRGLGCTASSKVSVPAAIRTSANWNPNKVKKIKVKNKKLISNLNNNKKLSTKNCASVMSNVKINSSPSSNSSQSDVVWCDPGIGLTGVAATSSVSARSKAVGVERIIDNQRKHSSSNMRRMATSEDISFRDPGIDLGRTHTRANISGSRYRHELRHGYSRGFAEIVMLQNSLLIGGRTERLDQYRDWRLDVDNMSYEELLELGDRIGHVNTGLKEDEISCCLRRTKVPSLDNISSNFPTETERKCSICQEEYETDDETGKLKCGHLYHTHCIKQWLVKKNICPICKKPAVP